MSSAPALDQATQRKLAWGALILIVAYLLARPWLERQLGMELPGGPSTVQTEPALPADEDAVAANPEVSEQELAELTTALQIEQPSEAPLGEVSVGATQDEPPATVPPRKPRPTPQIAERPAPPKPESKPAGEKEESDEASAESALGALKTVGNKVYQSTAGLQYGPGSVDGHRLLHVLKHAEDNPEKPVHGVYEGSKEEILALLDEAWLLVKAKSKQVKTEEEDDRTVYTIDMQRKIGFMGGEAGERKNHPPCKKLRIVVEDGNRVITAFPTDR